MEGRAPEKRAEEGRDADDGTTANKTAITRRSERERQSGKSKSRRMASAAAGEKEKEGRKKKTKFCAEPFCSLTLSRLVERAKTSDDFSFLPI